MKRGILLVLALLYLTTAQNPLDGSEEFGAASRAYFPLVNVNANVSTNYQTDFNATFINELPSLTTAQLQGSLQTANAILQGVRTRANQTLNNSAANVTAGVNAVRGQLSQFLSETSLRVSNIGDAQIHVEHSLRVLFALNQQEKLQQNLQLNEIPNSVVTVHVQNVANVQAALARSQALDQLEAACRAALLPIGCSRSSLAALTISPFAGTNATQTAIFSNFTTLNTAYNASVTGLLVSVTDVQNQLTNLNSSLSGAANSTLSAAYSLLVANLNNAKNFEFADYDTILSTHPLLSSSSYNAVFLDLVRYQLSDLITFGVFTTNCQDNSGAVRSFSCDVTSVSATPLSANVTAIAERGRDVFLSTFVGFTSAARATANVSLVNLLPVMTITVVELEVAIVRSAYAQALNDSLLQDARSQAQAQYQNETSALTQGAAATLARASQAEARARALSASLNDTVQMQLNEIQSNAEQIQESANVTVSNLRTLSENNQYANMSQIAHEAYLNRQAVLIAQWDVSSNVLQRAVHEAEVRLNLAIRDLYAARNAYDNKPNDQQTRDRYNSVVVGYSASLNDSLNLNASRVLAYQQYQEVVAQNTAVWVATTNYLDTHNEQLQQNATLAIATVRSEFQLAIANVTQALEEIIKGLRYPSVQNVSVGWDFTVSTRISVNIVIYDSNSTANVVNDHIAIIRSALILLSQRTDVSVTASSNTVSKRQSDGGDGYNAVVGDNNATPSSNPTPSTPSSPSTPSTPSNNPTPSTPSSPSTPSTPSNNPTPTPQSPVSPSGNNAAGVIASFVLLVACLMFAL